MRRKKKPLTRPGEPKQKTRKGLEIPVPKREEFFDPLEQATKTPPERRGKEQR